MAAMHRIISTPASFATALALSLLAIGAPAAHAAQPGDLVFEQQIGSVGRGDGQLVFPGGVASDAAGDVFVADTGNHRVQRFGPDGAYLGRFGGAGSGDGQFQFPSSLAIDAAGHLYVVDQMNNRIEKFTHDGVYELKWGSAGSGPGQFNSAQGIALAPDGSVYVADSGNHRVQRFNAAGTFLQQWGGQGSGNGQFATPYGIAVDQLGSVYVADSGNHRVQRFSAEGEFLGKWGAPGDGPGQFDFPDGIAVDGAGDVFVADSRNNRVQKFTGTGAFVTQFGSAGSARGRLNGPFGLGLGTAGRLYVADYGNHRIQAFRAAAPASFTAGPPALATLGRAYSGRIQADAFPAVGAFVQAGGSLPPGLALDASGLLSGTPTRSGSYTFAVRANNTVLPAATRSFTVVVASPAVFTSGLPARATVGRRYTAQLRASAFPAVSSFTVVAGALPRGLKLSPAGRVTGTPKRAGRYTVTIRADNPARPATTKRFTITVKKR